MMLVIEEAYLDITELDIQKSHQQTDFIAVAGFFISVELRIHDISESFLPGDGSNCSIFSMCPNGKVILLDFGKKDDLGDEHLSYDLSSRRPVLRRFATFHVSKRLTASVSKQCNVDTTLHKQQRIAQ